MAKKTIPSPLRGGFHRQPCPLELLMTKTPGKKDDTFAINPNASISVLRCKNEAAMYQDTCVKSPLKTPPPVDLLDVQQNRPAKEPRSHQNNDVPVAIL